MRKITSWIKSWFVRPQINRVLSGLYHEIEESRSELQAAQNEIGRLRTQLETVDQSLDNYQRMLNRADERLEEQRHRLKTAEEITIPTLLSNLEMFDQRWKAETAEHIYKQVALRPPKPSSMTESE